MSSAPLVGRVRLRGTKDAADRQAQRAAVERAIRRRLGDPGRPRRIRSRRRVWWGKRTRPRHIFIPDTQVRAGVEINHLAAEGAYVAEKRPDVLVIAGDWWDYPGINYYEHHMADYYVGDLLGDFCAGLHAWDVFFAPIRDEMRGGEWEPVIVYTEGNHEFRMWREIMRDRRNLRGIPLPEVVAGREGVRYYPYQVVVDADGILYTHVFVNPKSGRPWGGMASTRLKNVGRSFTQGHEQVFGFAMQTRPDGTRMRGLIAGANYQSYERYLGPQGNPHWRGIIVKNDVDGAGDYDVTEVRLEYLLRRYSPQSIKADPDYRADEFGSFTLAGSVK